MEASLLTSTLIIKGLIDCLAPLPPKPETSVTISKAVHHRDGVMRERRRKGW